MGKRHRRAHLSRYVVLLSHLLKWRFQSDRRSRSWRQTIARERLFVERAEEENGDFSVMAEFRIQRLYAVAVREAAKETGLSLSAFPVQCPFTVAELRDHDFLPE